MTTTQERSQEQAESIAQEARDEIARRDQNTREAIDTLRGKNDPFGDLMQERAEAEHRLTALIGGLHGLLGWHKVDGQIPVSSIESLLDAVKDA